MKTIVLHGFFKKLACESFKSNVRSFDELLHCLCSNFEGFENKVKSLYKKFDGFIVVADDKVISNLNEIDLLIQKAKKIDLIPVLKFSAVATATIVFTSIKVNALLALVINTVVFTAISIGISLLISKLLSPKQPNQIKTSSYIFKAEENRATRNTPIALNYGRLKIGSNIISFLNLNSDLTGWLAPVSSLSTLNVGSNLISAQIK